MFDENEIKPIRISMNMHHDDGTHVQFIKDYPEDTPWCEISKQFYLFLCAQGYVLDAERVGVEEW